MIKELEGHISDEAVKFITNTIKNQYCKYLQLIGSQKFKNIFLEEYAPHKKQHSVSWAIASAFPSGKDIIDNLKVERLIYGRGHTRPVLKNDLIELHILNKTTHFDADYLMQRYQYNSNNFSKRKLFAYIKFSVDHNKLISVSLCLPDQKGIVVKEELLLTCKELNLMVA